MGNQILFMKSLDYWEILYLMIHPKDGLLCLELLLMLELWGFGRDLKMIFFCGMDCTRIILRVRLKFYLMSHL